LKNYFFSGTIITNLSPVMPAPMGRDDDPLLLTMLKVMEAIDQF
jgi:hypothetical protein